jgi:CO/xanthine dehydrogenase FAD-binding subunit
MRVTTAERALVGAALDEAAIGAAASAAVEACDPFTDAVASEWYRRRMVGVTVRRALDALAARAWKEG